MMPRMRCHVVRSAFLPLALALLIAAAVTLSACKAEVSVGGETTVDSGDLEEQLADQLAPQVGAKPSDATVSCPDDQEAEKGARFSCTLAASNGDEFPVDVTLKDDKGTYDAVIPKSAR